MDIRSIAVFGNSSPIYNSNNHVHSLVENQVSVPSITCTWGESYYNTPIWILELGAPGLTGVLTPEALPVNCLLSLTFADLSH